jgi:ABC-type branched-subunit amino acid transport system substrate-binding protein
MSKIWIAQFFACLTKGGNVESRAMKQPGFLAVRACALLLSFSIAFCSSCSKSDRLQDQPAYLNIVVVGEGVPPLNRGVTRASPLNKSQGELMFKGVSAALERSAEFRPFKSFIKLISFDDAGDPQLAESIARKIIKMPNVLAVIGHATSETTHHAASIYESAGIPLIMPIATSAEVMLGQGASKDKPRTLRNAFRLPPADDAVQAPAAAWFVQQELKTKRLALVQDVTSGAIGYSAPLLEEITSHLSLDLSVSQVLFDKSNSIPGDLGAGINTHSVDTVLFCGYASTAKSLLDGLRAAYSSIPTNQRHTVVLTDGCLDSNLDASGFSVRILFPHLTIQSGITNFLDATILHDTFPNTPAPHYGLLGYDAMLIIGQSLSALSNSPVSRFSLTRQLHTEHAVFSGVAGTYEFVGGDNIRSSYDVYEVCTTNGNCKLTLIKTVALDDLKALQRAQATP